MTPAVKKARIDKFSRFLVLKEQANRRDKKPGFRQDVAEHPCGTPACVGGYLTTYPPFQRSERPNKSAIDWSIYLDLEWQDHFSGWNPSIQDRTALQAANAMRREVGLKPFKNIADARK